MHCKAWAESVAVRKYDAAEEGVIGVRKGSSRRVLSRIELQLRELHERRRVEQRNTESIESFSCI